MASNTTRLAKFTYIVFTWHRPPLWDVLHWEAQGRRVGYTQATLPVVKRQLAVAGACQSTTVAADHWSRCEKLPASTQIRTYSCRYPSSACCGTSAVVDRRRASAAASEPAAGEAWRRWWQLQSLWTTRLELRWGVVWGIVVQLHTTFLSLLYR